ncbi:hypothetical protein HALOI3_50320 [Halomonas sp. I3]|nr:hypothetical protein HALOI3_50320 [Halomonas sp. I3]VXB95335.1 hypothetical protein HALO153_230022 [Halomonas titanicae]VXC73136.1 hypothetical protein HALO98_90507 [Halomonas titanicae]
MGHRVTVLNKQLMILNERSRHWISKMTAQTTNVTMLGIFYFNIVLNIVLNTVLVPL